MSAKDELNRGRHLYIQQRYIESLSAFTTAMQNAWADGDRSTYYDALGCIGSVYYSFNDMQRSLFYLKKVVSSPDIRQFPELYARTLAKIVVCCCMTGDIPSAKYYLNLQIKNPQKNEKLRGYFLLTNEGLLAEKSKNYSEAVYLYNRASHFAQSVKMDPPYIAETLNSIGNSYNAEQKPDSALRYYKLYEQYSLKYKLLGSLSDAYISLMNFYKTQNDSIHAVIYQRKYTLLADSLFSQQRIKNANYNLTRSEENINNARVGQFLSTIGHQWSVILLLILLLVVMIMAFIIIIFQYRRQKKSWLLLIDKDKEIAAMPEQLTDGRQTSASSKSEHAQELLGKINSVLDDPYYIFNPDFNLDMLCKKVGSNTSYVSSVINDTYGKNFRTILNEKRVREGARRLTDEVNRTRTVESIALSLGYSSSTLFIISFKRVMGMTPAVYKRMVRQRKEQSSAQ